MAKRKPKPKPFSDTTDNNVINDGIIAEGETEAMLHDAGEVVFPKSSVDKIAFKPCVMQKKVDGNITNVCNVTTYEEFIIKSKQGFDSVNNI